MLCSLTRCASFFLLLILSACVSLDAREDISAYRVTIDHLERHLVQHPDDANALRELGTIYTRTGHFVEARPLLERAYT
ncbi:MAG TPA: hypothetical protein VKP65_13215, partial [Rhodothermales bacterium]|nr:hypothetical protein [Rhodothermales bacterium]